MSKVGNAVKAGHRFIQWAIYGFIFAAFISTIVGLILGTKSCSKDEKIEAKYFISDIVDLHDEFNLEVKSARTVNSIDILKNKDAAEKTTIEGNFIAVEIELAQKTSSSKKSHVLDANDFKLKDHTGLYLPLNTLMGLVNIDAMDMYVQTDEEGFVKSDISFSTRKAVSDYTWIGKSVTTQAMNIYIYFEMAEGYTVENEIMLMEADFYVGGGKNKGEDIVLARPQKVNDEIEEQN